MLDTSLKNECIIRFCVLKCEKKKTTVLIILLSAIVMSILKTVPLKPATNKIRIRGKITTRFDGKKGDKK